jgi:hypothetical protein
VAASGESHESLMSDPEANRLADVKFQPVFIIGLHRSGTTILYEVLMQTGCFNVTQAYHILNRDRLLELHYSGQEQQAREDLNRLLQSKGVGTRQYDSVPVNDKTPEEYGYVLDSGARRPTLNAGNLERLTRFCKTVQLTSGGNRPLLLKNPFDTVAFLYIQEAFPNARFVFIHRHPAQVIDSQIRGVRELLKSRLEYDAMLNMRYKRLFHKPAQLALARWISRERLPFLYLQVSRSVARNCDYVAQNIDSLGSQATSLTYPEFCADPNESVRRVLRFLGLEAESPRDYTVLVHPRQSKLLPRVQEHWEAIQARNRVYCDKFGV